MEYKRKASYMYGWCGKILLIDLETKSCTEIFPDREIYSRFIGGRGLAGFYLEKHAAESWKSSEMPLLFFTGPLADTDSPMSGWSTVMSISPLTGTVGDGQVGGRFGTMMKRAGIDGIIITGKSEYPCGLAVDEKGVVFENAVLFSGKTVNQVLEGLPEHGASAVAGPAAENGVLFSSIVVDRYFTAGRNGIGLVMADKNIKYITVSGNRRTNVADEEKLALAKTGIDRLVAASPALSGPFGFQNFGTGALYDLIDVRRMMPSDNFRKTSFNKALSMNAYAFREKYSPTDTGCFGCSVRCRKIAEDGRAVPEFEAMSHFSALINNHDIETVMKANALSCEYGFDPVSAAATIACLSEIKDKVLAPPTVIRLLNELTFGSGEGAELSSGSYMFALSKGRTDAAMVVKAQEIPPYDPRGALGQALAVAVSTRGACHLRAFPITSEILRKPVATDRFSFNGKARIVKISEDTNAVADSLAICKFVLFATGLEEYARIFSAVTGIETTGQDLLQKGAEIIARERAMNRARGFTADDDDLPERFFIEHGSSDSGITVNPIDRKDFMKARDAYYRIRGD